MRKVDRDRLVCGLVAPIVFCLMVRNGPDVAELLQQLELDGRCRHCGYRRDHPIVAHGPPCVAR